MAQVAETKGMTRLWLRWPSFREEEWVKENIVVSPDGDAEAGEMHRCCGGEAVT